MSSMLQMMTNLIGTNNIMLVKNRYPIGTIIEFPEKMEMKRSDIPGCANIELRVNGKLETVPIITDYAKYMNEHIFRKRLQSNSTSVSSLKNNSKLPKII